MKRWKERERREKESRAHKATGLHGFMMLPSPTPPLANLRKLCSVMWPDIIFATCSRSYLSVEERGQGDDV